MKLSKLQRKVLICMCCTSLMIGPLAGCNSKDAVSSTDSAVSGASSQINSDTAESGNAADITSQEQTSGQASTAASNGNKNDKTSSSGKQPSGGTPSNGSSSGSASTSANSTLTVNSYNNKDVFVVVVDATKAPYNADKTGKTDSTKAIQNAINKCQTTLGGGIVFLPKGTYKINDTITVKSHVTLKGEFQSPDKAKGDYGTVISVNTTKTAFTVNKSSGVSGLTTYYPNQSVSNPVVCDYTFVVPNGTAAVIENVTMLNSYKGIGVCTEKGKSHGLITLENVYGTVLNQGISISYAAEVGTVNNVYLSPTYWANATSKYNAPSESSIRSLMKMKSSSGLYLAGIEGIQYTNMLLDNFTTGVQTGPTPRSDGAEVYGQFYNLTVKNASVAADLPYLYTDMGIMFANSNLSGSTYSIKNTSPQVTKLFNCTVSGQTSGTVITSSDNVTMPSVGNKTLPTVKLTLFNVVTQYNADNTGDSDCSAAIQKALDAAKANGGGYVYMPGGIYRLDKPITVHANTILCGANATLGCDTEASNYAGTSVFCYYGKGKALSDTALVTLAGKNAGCTGMRFYYPLNGITVVGGKFRTTVDSYPYTVRGTAANTFCDNLNFYAAYGGVEMKGASDFVLQRCVGSFYKNGLRITGCNGGYINACLSNNGQQIITAYRYLSDFENWIDGKDLRPQLIEPIGRQMNDFIIYENSKNQTIVNTFAYIPHSFLTATNSTITGVNLYTSRMGAENYMYILNGGSITSFNNYLKNCQLASMKNNAGAKIYNIKCQIQPGGFSEENLIK